MGVGGNGNFKDDGVLREGRFITGGIYPSANYVQEILRSFILIS